MKSIQVQLTSKCNQHCVFCRKYTWPKKEIPLYPLTKILEKYKGATVTFSGGDPLAYGNIKKLGEYLIANKIPYQVLTNLTYDITNENYDFLLNAKAIQVSLDGSTKEMYQKIRGKDADFDKLLFNSKLFRNIKYNSTICKTNCEEITGLALIASKYNHPIRFWPVHTHDDMKLGPIEKFIINLHIKNLEENYHSMHIENTNLRDWSKLMHRKPFHKCFVKNEHRLIDEDGIEYPCCRAINDNGFDVKQAYSIDKLEELCNPDKLYEFCTGCDRYVRFNSNWDQYKDKEELFL